jgi:RNA polymerase sigma-70 factor (ECF subfamily)
VETLEATIPFMPAADDTFDDWAGPAIQARPKARRRREQPPRPIARRRHDRSKPATPLLSECSDELLVNRLQGGDVAAGEVLVKRHTGPLRRYLHRLAGTGAAEELHQQTWLSVLDHLDRFVATATTGSFRGWLFRIAGNKVKDHWRSASREKCAKEGFGRIRDEWAPGAEADLEVAEAHERLRRALEALPEGQRHVLMLRYYADMKFLDIAAILECPLNTALTRAHKGLIKLRQALAEVR